MQFLVTVVFTALTITLVLQDFHGKHKSTHVGTKAQLSGLHLLTYSQLLPKDRPLAEGRAVPASVAKLILALVDAQLSALPDDDDGIRAALTDGTLSGGQTGDLVADDVRTQSHDGRQSPLEKTIHTDISSSRYTRNAQI